MSKRKQPVLQQAEKPDNGGRYSFTPFNAEQAEAWRLLEQNEIIFLLGAAGCGKTQLATAFASKAILDKRCRKMLLSRPMVTTEPMGFLPGSADDKIHPFLLPIIDSLDACLGAGQDRKRVDNAIEFAPLAFLRGRSFNNAVAILDEAQNCTYQQLKLFLTRIGRRSKLLITGDPMQSDLLSGSCLEHVAKNLSTISGVAVVEFSAQTQVRNPIINKILNQLELKN